MHKNELLPSKAWEKPIDVDGEEDLATAVKHNYIGRVDDHIADSYEDCSQ